MSDFDVNCKLVIFSHVKYLLLEKGFEEPNDGVRERVVALAQSQSWGILFVPAIFSILRISTDFAPCPGVKMYRLTSTLCQPLSLSNFGCACGLSGIKYERLFYHCFSQVRWTWRRSCILEILFVLRVKTWFSYLGLDSSCIIEQSHELTLVGVIRRKWWNNAWM